MPPVIDYAALHAIASSTIAAFGRGATLLGIDGAAPVPVTVVMLDYGARERDGDLILPSDKRAIIAATPGVNPNPEIHTLKVDGINWRVVSTRELRPGPATLYFDCQVRK